MSRDLMLVSDTSGLSMDVVLRRHLNGKKAKAQFYLLIPVYRPMLVKDPLEFLEKLFSAHNPMRIT